MKRITVLRALLGWLIVATIAGCSAPPTPAKPTPSAALSSPGVSASGRIIAQGRVTPVKSAALSVPSAGIVAELLVREGDHVDANQVILRLAAAQPKAAVAQAQANLQRAQAARQKLNEPPDQNLVIAAQADLANANAALKAAQAAYDRVGGASNPQVGMLPTTLALEQAGNNYSAAKARLDTLMKGPAAADLASADAGIAAAQADLTRAQAALADTELHAPFAGTIASLDVKLGEEATPGAPVVQLADFSNWQVETTDLTELNVVKVQAGNAATLSFDAIPDLALIGKVTAIKAFGTNRQGDIVYTVIITPDQQDARLRWNMTAKVTIEPSK